MTPNSDGTPASQDSPELPAPDAVAPDVSLTGRELELANRVKERTYLKSLGLTPRSARLLLANGKSTKYLNTKLSAQLLLIAQVNSLEGIELIQKKAAEYSNNTDFPPAVRVASLGCMAQSVQALSRLSEVALATARAMDDDEKPPVNFIQNNKFEFPPVATESRRPMRQSATSGDGSVTEIASEVK